MKGIWEVKYINGHFGYGDDIIYWGFIGFWKIYGAK